MEKTTLYLPAELHRSLRDIGRRQGRPQAEVIREALARYVDAQERPWPRSIGMASDGSIAGRSSEAWLRDEWSSDDARPLRRTSRG